MKQNTPQEWATQNTLQEWAITLQECTIMNTALPQTWTMNQISQEALMLYVKLKKALYGTLQAALLFW